MKPTQLTELFANIKNTFVSFFSILMFVALGVGIFLGISWAGPALQTAANRAFDEGSLHHFQVQYPYGFTDGNLLEMAALEGVADVEGVRQSFQVVELDGKRATMKVQTAGERINTLRVREGELPSRLDEIALNAKDANALGLGVGDVLEFQNDADDEEDADGMKYLHSASFKVTALVDSPEYLADSAETHGSSPNGSGIIDVVAWVGADSFDDGAFRDGYPIVNVSCSGFEGVDSFSDEYKSASAEMEQRISGLAERLAEERYQSEYDSAKSEVDDAEAKLNDAKNELAQKESELADARSQVDSGASQLDSMCAKLQKGERELASKKSELKKSERQLDSAQSEFDAAVPRVRKKLENEMEKAAVAELLKRFPMATDEMIAQAKAEAKKEADAKVDDVEITQGGKTATIREMRKELKGNREKIEAARAEVSKAERELKSGWNAYYQKESELADARASISDGEAKLEDGRKTISENEAKLEDAKRQLEDLKSCSSNIAGRSYNAGVAEVSMFSDVTNHLSWSMAALFIIVGLLVSYSAVSRIVHEQIMQIGTKKALGLREKEVALGFLAYSAIAVVSGAVIGTIVGVIAVEGIIGHVLGGMFILGDYPPFFGLPLFLAVSGLELVLVLGTTWFACHGIMREHAVELLKGEKPPEGKTRFYEKWGIWDKLPLLTQTIVNNCMNDKRRVFSTIVGVAGCTALIVTALTLNDDVLKSYDRHYENVFGFNGIAYVDTDVDGAANDVEEVIEGKGFDSTQVRRQGFVVDQPNGERGSVRAIVPADADGFSRLYHVNPVSGGELDLAGEGAWVSQAYAEHQGAKVGDTIRVDAGDGVRHDVTILGFYEFWLTHQEMVMGREFYEREFEADLVPNALLVDAGDSAGLSDLSDQLAGIDGVESVVDDKVKEGVNFKTFSNVSRTVVLIYLVLSILMAIVVLLNLNVMFIDEKKRELIVLMINGFSVHDAKRYIYNDTVVLVAVGIIVGLVFGCAMGSITVGSVEPATAVFLKEVDWIAVGVGVGGSIVLSFVMSAIALRRVPRFELTDINKF